MVKSAIRNPRSEGRPRSESRKGGVPCLELPTSKGRWRLRISDLTLLVAVRLLTLLTNLARAEHRFPPPEFDGGHQLPVTTTPPAREVMLQYLDVAVLGASLALGSWLVYKRRSRKGLMALSIFSVLYFGFWRNGHACFAQSDRYCLSVRFRLAQF